MEENTERLKNFFQASSIEVFGIAPTSFLEREPAGYRPSDLIQEAKSLICLGLPVPRGIFKSKGRDLRLYWRTANIYYRQIDAILLKAARLIEENGEMAVPVFG